MKEIKKDDDLDLFLPSGYVAPKAQESIVDTATGKIEDIKSLPPLEQIKYAAKKFNIPVNDAPKKNCKKCFERGYIGFSSEDKMPVPCPCMFPPKVETKEQKGQVPLSFLPKKAQKKYFRDKKKQLMKDIKKESTLRSLRKVKEEMIDNLANSLISGGDKTEGEQAFSPVTTENNGSSRGTPNESEEMNG